MDVFSNREISLGIWLIITLIIIVSKRKTRKYLGNIFKILFNKKIILLILISVIYTALIVISLYYTHFWNISLLKDTIIWFCFSGIVINFKYVIDLKKDDNLVKRVILDNIKAVIILEFILNIYSFPLYIEIFLLPVITLVVIFEVVASKMKFLLFANIMKGFVFIIGIGVFTFAIYKIVSDYKNFTTFNTLKEFLLTPIFTITFMPLIYFMVLYTNYEQVFVRLVGIKDNPKLKNYAKMKIMKYCLLDLRKVRKILYENIPNLLCINNKKNVKDFIKLLGRKTTVVYKTN